MALHPDIVLPTDQTQSAILGVGKLEQRAAP